MMESNSNTRISKSELISTLSDIDIKINNLHNRSATDFMQLNDHLKDYHKKTRLISENAFRIFETISGGKDIDLIKELGNIQNRIEDYRRNIDADNERKLKIFKDAYLKANHLNIVVRNLRQDFTALKFLSTNYALISNYNDRNVNESEINSWTQNLSDIHHLLVDLNEKVEKFRGVIASMIHELETRIERSIEIFQNLSGETIRNIDSVTRKKLESKQQFPVLKEKSLESSRCINDIITHLQYHDIIRQKIEHIQKSHYRIIDGLNQGGARNKEYCSAEDYVKIGDIIDLQAAQLLLVSKEYQNALNVITRNFQVIAKDMTIVSDISDKFTLENSSSETTLLRQIKDQLDKGIIQLDQNYAGNTDILTDAAFEKLQPFSEMIENDIKPQLSAFVTENIGNKFQFSPAGSGVLSQMISLNRDIEIKNQEIWVLVAELKNLTHNTAEYTGPSGWANDFEIDRLQLMVRITRILDSLDRDNEDLDKVLNENREMNNNILSKIETAVNKSDYCEYFESIVGEVIAQLTSINNRINPSSGVETRSENLKEIKSGYTMESERIIHDMVVSGNEKIESSTSDNEIEFF
jgi:hypothetical protein